MKLPSKFQIGETVRLGTMESVQGVVKDILFCKYFTMPQYTVVVIDYAAVKIHTVMEDMLLPVLTEDEKKDESV